jgi:arylformamidase
MIDVTRKIVNHGLSWFEGTPVSYSVPVRIADGASVNLGIVTMSTHMGTHVDAPWHYIDSGLKLDAIPLETWVGPCMVVDAVGVSVLTPALLQGLDLSGISKVLFKTGQPNAWSSFPLEWAIVDPSLPPFLATRGVGLIGTDAPSADLLTSTDLPGHAALAASGVCILEALALDGVAPGRYRLVCLPLHLEGADGAPARCILE